VDEFDELERFCQARVGQILARKWTLDSLLGFGGMAAVYKATHRNGARGAIKMLHPEISANPDVRERFLREAYVSNKVGHPGAVSVFDDDVDENNSLYIVMELLTGQPLDSRQEEAGGTLGVEETLTITDQLLAVLEAAHPLGIVHRDIKPENIFLTETGMLKLLDFGIARMKDAAGNKTATGMLLGTPAFMPPEQALGRHKMIDGRTDLWAVGAVMFNLLTGRRVHEGNSMHELLIAAATEPVRSLSRVMPGAPFEVVRLVDRALQFEPSQRFPDATAMRAELAALLPERGPEANAASSAEPAPAPPSAKPPPRTTQSEAQAPAQLEPRVPAQPSQRSRPGPMDQADGLSMPHQIMMPKGGVVERSVRSRRDASAKPRAGSAAAKARAGSAAPRTVQQWAGAKPDADRREVDVAGTPQSQGRIATEVLPALPDLPPRKPTGSGVSPGKQPPLSPPAEEQVDRSLSGPASSGAAAAWPELDGPRKPLPSRAEPEPEPEPPQEEQLLRQPSRRKETGKEPLASALVEAELRLSPEEVADLKELFKLLEKKMIGESQYGKDHPVTASRQEGMNQHLKTALSRNSKGLLWKVAPYGFVAHKTSLWEPNSPLDRIPFQLFADGVRVVWLRPELENDEFQRFIQIITLNRAQEMSPEDDFVTLLWEACFDNIDFEAIDAFAEGNQEKREAFEKGKDKIVAMAQMDTGYLLEESWQEHRGSAEGSGQALMAQCRDLVGTLSGGNPLDLEVAVKASAFGDATTRHSQAGQVAAALRPDATERPVLNTQLNMNFVGLGKRFAITAVEAYVAYAREGKEKAVLAPLRRAVDGLARTSPLDAIEMVHLLCDALQTPDRPDEAETFRSQLATALFAKDLLGLVLSELGAMTDVDESSEAMKGLVYLLGYLGPGYLSTIVETLADQEPGLLFHCLRDYIAEQAPTNEALLAQVLPGAQRDFALEIIRILGKLTTPEAREAVAKGMHNPDAVVRIEALGFIEGESGEKLRKELCSLLEADEEQVRIAALRAMAHHHIRVAGPFLAVRVKTSAFANLEVKEKRQALVTLATLAPKRGESICQEILNTSKLLASDSHEETRALAAEVLGRMGASVRTVTMLGEMAKKRWKNSDRVRAAAQRALDRLEKDRNESAADPKSNDQEAP
jgi:serine/threonine-protein kinase